jgi:CRISPR/Cas system-associated endonuclease Cas3-HD
MASEEVNKILSNLNKLKETKLGEGENEDDEVGKLKQELDEEMLKREEEERKEIEAQKKKDEAQQQIIARSVEVLNNNGVYRHAMLEKMSLIENHLKVIAVCLVKVTGVDDKPEPTEPTQTIVEDS